MRTAEFDYELPLELIAQTPALARDRSRLLVLHRSDGRIAHRSFRDLPEYLRAGDALVLNDSRVIPARLRAMKAGSGGQIEVLLLEQNSVNDWWVMLRPGKRVRGGTSISILNREGRAGEARAEVLEKNGEGLCRLRFGGVRNIREMLDAIGEVPLPPYITRDAANLPMDDRER